MNRSSGGAGGGGAGGALPGTAGVNGTNNTGGGGGGAVSGPGMPYCGTSSGSGGPGIVIIRAPSVVSFSISPGCSGSTSTHPGGDKIATITASGTLTIS